MATFIKHDQDIMDLLDEKYGEDAVVAFGEALSDEGFIDLTDAKSCAEKVEILNGVLDMYDVNLTVLSIVQVDDDGYDWLVREKS